MADSCNFGNNGCPSVHDDSQIDQQQGASTKKTKSRQHLADESVKMDNTKTSQTKPMPQSVQQFTVPLECIVVF